MDTKTFYVNTYNNPWKNEQGVWRVKELFYETCRVNERERVIYCLGLMPLKTTIANKDVTLQSLRNVYMDMDHIPEFEHEFAETYLGGWTHWLKVQRSSAVGPHVQEWKAEKNIKIKADAIKQLLATAKNDTKDSFQAAKFLAQKGYNVGEVLKRNSKKEEESFDKEVDEDLKRIGLLKVVK